MLAAAPMNEAFFAFLVFACLTAASLGTLFLHGKMRQDHRTDETQNVVKLAFARRRTRWS